MKEVKQRVDVGNVKTIIMAIKHKDLKKVVSELEGAVKAHGRQAKTIKQHIKDMSGPFKMKSPFVFISLSLKSIFGKDFFN